MDVTQVHASAGSAILAGERSGADPRAGRTVMPKQAEPEKSGQSEPEKPRKAEEKRPALEGMHAPDIRFRASGSPVEPPVIEVLDSSGEVVRTIPPDSSGEIVNMSA